MRLPRFARNDCLKRWITRLLSPFMLALIPLGADVQAESANRIISLDLCTDWMLLKYADRSRVKAYSPLLYRYRADWVPDGLRVHDGSLEQILQLEPDLVITGEYNAITLRKRLRQLGTRVEVLALPTGLDSIRAYQRQFYSLIDTELKHDERWERRYSVKSRSLLMLGANGIGTGRDTLENDLIESAGWDNYIHQSGYVSLQLEEIISDPPDAVYWSAPLSNSLANLVVGHRAIRKAVPHFMVPTVENWRWECPGPWSLDLIDELAQWTGS